MSTRIGPRRAFLSAIGVLAAGLSLTACTPPVIGSVTLARLPDGAVAAVVVLCRGTVTELEMIHYPVDGDREDDVVTWTGALSERGTTVIPLTGSGWTGAPGHQYDIRGWGEQRETGLFRAGQANLRGEGEIDTAVLEALAPDEVVEWDAGRQRTVAVTRADYEAEQCAGASDSENDG